MRSSIPRIRRIGVAAVVHVWATLLPAAVGIEKAAPVSVTTVEERVMEDVVVLSGTATAERRSALSARTAGLVQAVRVDAGSLVKEGEVLLELDAALATLALERAREALAEARAAHAESRRLVDEGTQLARSGNIPKTDLEARLSALRAREAAENQLAVNVREREEIVSRHRLVAPFSGVIAKKVTEVGEWVETGVPVLELVAVDRVRFDVQAPQERYSLVHDNSPVTVRLDTDPAGNIRRTSR